MEFPCLLVFALVPRKLELMFVEPDMMGAGLGDTLMHDVVDRLREGNVTTLWILSDPGAEAFYVRYGAARVGLQPSDAIAGRKLPWLRLDIDGLGVRSSKRGREA